MEIEIKAISSPDILDFINFEPEDKTNFYFLLELEIGIKGKEGADLFSIEVCTPKWLLQKYGSKEVIFGNGKVIVFDYDFNNILNAIKAYLKSIRGDSWADIANKLSKIAHWEFEDYK